MQNQINDIDLKSKQKITAKFISNFNFEIVTSSIYQSANCLTNMQAAKGRKVGTKNYNVDCLIEAVNNKYLPQGDFGWKKVAESTEFCQEKKS